MPVLSHVRHGAQRKQVHLYRSARHTRDVFTQVLTSHTSAQAVQDTTCRKDPSACEKELRYKWCTVKGV